MSDPTPVRDCTVSESPRNIRPPIVVLDAAFNVATRDSEDPNLTNDPTDTELEHRVSPDAAIPVLHRALPRTDIVLPVRTNPRTDRELHRPTCSRTERSLPIVAAR